MDFNPDAYLASVKQPAGTSAGAGAGGFDPDAYLAQNKIAAPKPTLPKAAAPSAGAGWDWYDKVENALGAVKQSTIDLAGAAAVPYLNIASLMPGSIGEQAKEDALALQRDVSPISQVVGGMIGGAPLAVAASELTAPLAAAYPLLAPWITTGTGAAFGAATSPPGERSTGAALGALGAMAPKPVQAAAQAVSRGASYLVNPEASAGAKGARAMARGLQQEFVVPGEEPIMRGGPAKPNPPDQLPLIADTKRPSTIQINADLSKALEANGAKLDAARKAAGEQINRTIAKAPQKRLTPDDPLYNEINEIRDFLIQEQEDAGTGTQRAALQSVINDLAHIQNNSYKPLSSLVDLRRQLSQKAKFGQEVTGFDAIGTQASASLSRKLNDVLDKHIDGYKAARAKYGDVLDEQTPFHTRMLKSLGADETGGDLVAKVMQSPKNLDLAIKAAGDTKPVDAAVAKRVQADMHGKSIDAMEAYIAEHQPILEKLPNAMKSADDVISRAKINRTLQDIQKRAEAQYKDQHDAYLKSHELAEGFMNRFTELKNLPPDKVPEKLRRVLWELRDKKLISRERYEGSLEQVNQFEKSIKQQKYVRNTLGLGSAAATAAGFAQYAMHRKMWNIIVGATE
jgi:hypothetical protein